MKFTGIIAAALTVGAAVAAPAPVKKADPLASVLSIASGLKTEVASKLSSIRTFPSLRLPQTRNFSRS